MQTRVNWWTLAGWTMVALALLVGVHFTGLPVLWQQILQVAALILMAAIIELCLRAQRVALLHSSASRRR